MRKKNLIDLRNRAQLETAIFNIYQYVSLIIYGDFIPEEEGWKLVVRIITSTDLKLKTIFQEQMDTDAALNYFTDCGVNYFIAPNGDIYNLMDNKWFIMV